MQIYNGVNNWTKCSLFCGVCYRGLFVYIFLIWKDIFDALLINRVNATTLTWISQNVTRTRNNARKPYSQEKIVEVNSPATGKLRQQSDPSTGLLCKSQGDKIFLQYINHYFFKIIFYNIFYNILIFKSKRRLSILIYQH